MNPEELQAEIERLRRIIERMDDHLVQEKVRYSQRIAEYEKSGQKTNQTIAEAERHVADLALTQLRAMVNPAGE
jgi:predicted  nucleic acid-binding Zn-ribbon protein